MARLTIIGSGLAAVSAALAARKQGHVVELIAGRPGATALASGAWDFGMTPDFLGEAGRGEVPSPRELIARIVKMCPDHPYTSLHRVVGGEDLTIYLADAMRALTDQMPDRPLGSLDEMQACLTPLGTIKYTTLLDPGQAPGNLLKMRKARLLIAGIPGLANFPVSLIAKVLDQAQSQLADPPFATIDTTELALPGLPQHSLSPFALAQRLETEEDFAALSELLRAQVRERRATHVLLPPVIGVEKNPELMTRLRSGVGALCFESLATVPSVPGLRRYRALESVLQGQDITLISGDVSAFESAGKRVKSLTVSGPEGTQSREVERVILATGCFIGGGVVKAKEMRESIFKLPVFAEGSPVGRTFVGKLVHRKYFGEHPLFSVGLHIDTEMRAVNEWGVPVFENLLAAGSLLGGGQGVMDGSGSGVALLSGWCAGLKGGG